MPRVRYNSRGEPIYEGLRPEWATSLAEKQAADLQYAPRLRLRGMSIEGNEMGGYSGINEEAQANLDAERMWRQNVDPWEGPRGETFSDEVDLAQGLRGPQNIRDMYLARSVGYYDQHGNRKRRR